MIRKSVEELIDLLSTNDDKLIRWRATIALRNRKDQARSAIPILLEVLKNDSYYKVREEAAKTLATIVKEDQGIIKELVTTMLEDENELVRKAATNALTELNDIAVPALFGVLANEQKESVIEEAIISLGIIGEWALHEEPELAKAIAQELIKKFSPKNNERIKRGITEAIIKMKIPAALLIIKEIEENEEPAFQEWGKITLERIAIQQGYKNHKALIRAIYSE
ncbi:MAG: hypothetical protein GF308_08575 [Candidatus Heimdallarchaeota archaeon]|nr:hypothetical protein [Candidatus Heimdallarchaeota archaeon]